MQLYKTEFPKLVLSESVLSSSQDKKSATVPTEQKQQRMSPHPQTFPATSDSPQPKTGIQIREKELGTT